jgi:hypothetical protein
MIVQSGCGKASSSGYDGFIVDKEQGKSAYTLKLPGTMAKHGKQNTKQW